MKLTYIGREEEVCVPTAEGQPRVKRNHSHDFESEVAQSLLKQNDNWRRTHAPKKRAVKKAAEPAPKADEPKGNDKK